MCILYIYLGHKPCYQHLLANHDPLVHMSSSHKSIWYFKFGFYCQSHIYLKQNHYHTILFTSLNHVINIHQKNKHHSTVLLYVVRIINHHNINHAINHYYDHAINHLTSIHHHTMTSLLQPPAPEALPPAGDGSAAAVGGPGPPGPWEGRLGRGKFPRLPGEKAQSYGYRNDSNDSNDKAMLK